MNSKHPKIGEVWLVDLPDTKDRAIHGLRPALIVSHDGRNVKCPLITIIPLSRYSNKMDKLTKSSIHVFIEKENNSWLRFDSIALCEQETSCDISRFHGYLGLLSDNDMDEIAILKTIAQPTWITRALKQKVLLDPRFISSINAIYGNESSQFQQAYSRA